MATGQAQGVMLFDFDRVLIWPGSERSEGFAGIPVTGANSRAEGGVKGLKV